MTRLSEERKRIPASLVVFPFLVNWILSWRFGEEEEEEAVNFINFKLFTNYHQKRRRSITWKIRKKEKNQSADEGGSSSVPGADISGSGAGGGEDAGGGEATEVVTASGEEDEGICSTGTADDVSSDFIGGASSETTTEGGTGGGSGLFRSLHRPPLRSLVRRSLSLVGGGSRSRSPLRLLSLPRSPRPPYRSLPRSFRAGSGGGGGLLGLDQSPRPRSLSRSQWRGGGSRSGQSSCCCRHLGGGGRGSSSVHEGSPISPPRNPPPRPSWPKCLPLIWPKLSAPNDAPPFSIKF